MVKLIVTIGFLVAFAAGLTVGFETRKSAPAAQPPTTKPSGPQRSGFLREALNLSPDQQEKMKKIWGDGPPANFKDQRERRDKCRGERDEAVLGLMTAEQKEKYDQIQKDYRAKVDAIDQELRADFQKKVEQTKEILTPEQQTKYDELLARRQPFDRGPGDHGPGERGSDNRGGRGRGDHGPRESNRRSDGATSLPRSEP